MATPQRSLIQRMEDLPLELRLRIYQAYLDSPILEDFEQFKHDLHVQNVWRRQEFANQTLNRTPRTLINERIYYRQDTNDGSGFWSPFGMTTKVVDAHVDTYELTTPVLDHFQSPALWNTSSWISREAQDYHFNERLRLMFTYLGDLQEVIRVYREWRSHLSLTAIQQVRKIHVDVNYHSRSVANTNDRFFLSQPIDLRHRSCPFFRVDTRDDGRTLRVMSLFQVVQTQIEKFRKKLVERLLYYRGRAMRDQSFNGDDIFGAVDALIEVMNGPTATTQTFRVWDGISPLIALVQERSMFWRVKLTSDELERMKPVQAKLEGRLSRNEDVWLTGRLQEDDEARLRDYKYVVAELKLAPPGLQ